MTNPEIGSIQGYVASGFERVQQAFEKNFEVGTECPEVGAAVCMTHHGEVVVDLYGGFADAAKSQPWQQDTIVNTFSTTKGIAASCIAILESQGLLDYARPVSHYWPEFAACGKQDITVAMLLSHQAGLSGLPLQSMTCSIGNVSFTSLSQPNPCGHQGLFQDITRSPGVSYPAN